MLCGVILMVIESSIIMENGAWNLSKHETYILFKFFDQVNKDDTIYNLSDFLNHSGTLNSRLIHNAFLFLCACYL